MYRVLSCLTTQHDYRLVFLAAGVCLLSSLTAFYILSRASGTRGSQRLGWIVLTGLAAGAGVWSTHFVAMLGYQSALHVEYDATLTGASLAIAIVMTGLGFHVADHRPVGWAAAGGALIGAGIATMHFTGMHALSVAGTIEWELDLVAASIVLGIALGAASTVAYASLGQASRLWAGAALFGLAICAMHFTAMGAAVIVPDPTYPPARSILEQDTLAITVAGVTFLIIVAGAAAALIDGQTRQEAFARLHELANAAIEGIVVAKDGVVVDVNNRILELCGSDDAKLIYGRAVFGDLMTKPETTGRTRTDRPFEAFLKDAGGRSIPVEVVHRRFQSGERANEVYAVRDLRERRAAESRIRYLAHHDGLTGLPNRTALNEKLDAVLKRAAAADFSFAVLCVDLDHFKDVNDIHGHAAGDRVLREAAERLKNELRAGDIVGRVGGDEFIIVQTRRRQPAAAHALANRLVDSFERMFEVDGQLTQLGVSIGIAVFPQNGQTRQQLMSSADVALYRAKSDGRGRARFFDTGMDEAHRKRKRLAQALRGALADSQLELHYQPQVQMSSGELLGFEALLRWRHPDQGLVSPTEFIPLAEETGVIVPIGEWVLRSACLEAKRWKKPYRVAVNLSPRQFAQPDLHETIHRILLETGLPATRLELEITESALFQDYQRALDTLRRLKALGVSIAMDDYGTGYSSLSVLQAFPFDKLKIDRTFVGQLGSGRQAATIVRSVVNLGHSLEIPVLAEGVETADQAAFLDLQGCDEVQGYYYGKPMPPDELRALTTKGFVTVPAPEPQATREPDESPAESAA